MRIPRLHCTELLRTGDTVTLPNDAARHVSRVLRAQPGDPIRLFNGKGGEYDAVIDAIHGTTVTARVGVHHAQERESFLSLTLIQGISRGERMDFTLQKAVELGIGTVVAVATERTVVRLSGTRLEKRLGHWQRVVISACEQCGRNRIPAVHYTATLRDALHRTTSATRLLLDPAGTASLRDLSQLQTDTRGATLLAGPEGGFSDRERSEAIQAGFVGLRLGPRILRTETAALAALAGLQALWGDLA